MLSTIYFNIILYLCIDTCIGIKIMKNSFDCIKFYNPYDLFFLNIFLVINYYMNTEKNKGNCTGDRGF